MNLYDIHPDPENAPYREWAFDRVPELVWERYQKQPEELKKHEKIIAKDAKYAYYYARWVLNRPFPEGETAIATDPEYAYYYAWLVLLGPFPAGEAVIAEHPYYAQLYARDVLTRLASAEDPILAT